MILDALRRSRKGIEINLFTYAILSMVILAVVLLLIITIWSGDSSPLEKLCEATGGIFGDCS